jgi:toxin-antitoxin system PIN domain toxin
VSVALLDGNVLIALAVPDHDHHQLAHDWLRRDQPFASNPITQGSLIRFLVHQTVPSADAIEVLDSITAHPRHEFWPADIGYTTWTLSGVVGHRQVTDAYLATHAASRGGSVVTFDVGLAALRPDVVELIPT